MTRKQIIESEKEQKKGGKLLGDSRRRNGMLNKKKAQVGQKTHGGGLGRYYYED